MKHNIKTDERKTIQILEVKANDSIWKMIPRELISKHRCMPLEELKTMTAEIQIGNVTIYIESEDLC
jgi:hypothetical protein